MELLPAAVRQSLPSLGTGEIEGLSALARVHFFTPDSSWDWYASAFDGDDLFFGLVFGSERELGFFTLSELRSVRGHLGLPVERDLWFEPVPLETLFEASWH